jgi:hypothetical protein
MPVRRFRDVSEMPEPWLERGDPRLPVAMRSSWSFAERIARPRFPPGVYKARSVSEADALREQWDADNFRRFQARKRATR